MSRHYFTEANVAGVADDLARSLTLERPVLSTLSIPTSQYSPSGESSFSDHSLFSDQSHATNGTTSTCLSNSQYGEYDSLDGHSNLYETSYAYDATPRNVASHPSASASSRLKAQSAVETSAPFGLPTSRLFSRRGAIAPLPAIGQLARSMSAFGPMRGTRAPKTARTSFTPSHLQIPQLPRPQSPPPKTSNIPSMLPRLVLPQRKHSMPTPVYNLGSPMKLCSPAFPATKHSKSAKYDTRMSSETDDIDGDHRSSDEDFDFCCRGSDSPMIVQATVHKPTVMYSPYRRESKSQHESQLGKRRGKLVPRLRLK